ncbi:MAG: phosphatidylserine decarboxylase [Bdellovibrionales bacterium]|nr:phosphatidylserine decarboxylase [Bdellovibrionales bacterium]
MIFSKLYSIDISTASREIGDYRSIGEFFVRDLKPGMRPIDSGFVSPVDGTLRSSGSVFERKCFIVKDVSYDVAELVLDPSVEDYLINGRWFNFYLSPQDYHHVHSPIDGEIVSCTFIPGTLLPVNDFSLKRVPHLFTLNERVVVAVKTQKGLVVVVLVGALNVGRIEMAFSEFFEKNQDLNVSCRQVVRRELSSPLPIRAGDRLGTFYMGSSVIVIAQEGVLQEGESLSSTRVVYGMRLAPLA